METKPNVALLGLGTMGHGMAQNLLKAGFPLTVYNRTRAKAEALAAMGATVADTPALAARELCIGAGRSSPLIRCGRESVCRFPRLGRSHRRHTRFDQHAERGGRNRKTGLHLRATSDRRQTRRIP